MNKLKTYVRNNRMFILLLSVIMIITVALGVYYVNNVMETKPKEEPVEKPNDDDVDKSTAIASFQGAYDTKTKQIRLSWSLQQGDQALTSLGLYHDESFLADVNSLSSYVLNQAVYQFPGGENVFILKGTLENGDKIEKEARITIEYFNSISCTTEPSDNGILIKLTYKYHEAANVETPRIVANSLPYNYKFNFKESKKSDPEDGYITGTTIFEVDSREAQTDEKVTIRWIFDSIGMSYDFPITITAKGNTPVKE